MNILFDFSSIVSGGGAQLAINFLEQLEDSQKEFNINPTILFPRKGPIGKSWQNSSSLNVYNNPSSYISRYIFERTELYKIYNKHQIDRIYTFFGPGLPHHPNIRSYVGVAYPIICYPDSPYWNYLPIKSKIRQQGLNYLRVTRLQNHADMIIAETAVMSSRLNRNCNLKNVRVLPPAPTSYLNEVTPDQDIGSTNSIKIGLISGLDQHKNIWRLPSIADAMLKKGRSDFEFVLTVPAEKGMKLLLGKEYLKKWFKFIGPVMPKSIEDFYQSVDMIMNISDLESYSNNYMEAWLMGKPIISSDRDFARAILRESACYIEPHQPENAAEKILALLKNPRMLSTMMTKGKDYLNQLPSQKERFLQVMSIICE